MRSSGARPHARAALPARYDNECSINYYNNINSNDDDEDGDIINDENEIHVGAHMLCSVA